MSMIVSLAAAAAGNMVAAAATDAVVKNVRRDSECFIISKGECLFVGRSSVVSYQLAGLLPKGFDDGFALPNRFQTPVNMWLQRK